MVHLLFSGRTSDSGKAFSFLCHKDKVKRITFQEKKIKYFEEKKGGMDELHKKDDEIHIEKCHYKVDLAIWNIIEHFLAYKALSE